MAGIPRGASALLSALRFTGTSEPALAGLTSGEWQDLLSFGDRTQLILPLNERCGQAFPAGIRSAVDRRLEAQCVRVQRLKASFVGIDEMLRRAGIDYTVLKGFTHCPEFIPRLHDRVQYDIDLYTPDRYRDLYEVLQRAGYVPIQAVARFPVDHLPTLIRKTGWEWRGDFYDPDLPFSVEVHYRLWDRETERLSPEGIDEFHGRRVFRREHGLAFTSFHPADRLGYASLHLLRHLLRGSLKPLHVYELAWFLQTHARDDAFWNTWIQLHSESLRRLEALCFALAAGVFACDLHPTAASEVGALPRQVLEWMRERGPASLTSVFYSNKDELWLHLSLLESAADRRAVFFRRVLPVRMPGPVDAVHLPDEMITWRIHVRKRWRYFRFVWSRVVHHTRALPPVLENGIEWWLQERGISRQFLRFLAAAAVYELGLFVFYLLYSLLLLDRGFQEDFIGANAGAMQAGGIAGAIPAGLAAQKWGLHRTITFSVAVLAIVSSLRVIITQSATLLALAFMAGMLASCWMICIAPAVSELSDEQSRPVAFSLFFATGIGVGVLGGVVGGYLPVTTTALGIAGKEPALLAGCALLGMGAVLFHRLRLQSSPGKARLYRGNLALWKFLLLIALFSGGTGAFNPLYAAFLSGVAKLPVERIGTVFAISQLAQVAAVLAGGAVVRRFGFTVALGWMFAGTAASLLLLSSGPAGMAAASAYVLYMCFQYMSEPGMFTLLMSLVPSSDRQGASTLNFLVMNAAQASAAFVAGVAVARLGYGPVLGTAAGIVLLAAVLMRISGLRSAPHPQSDHQAAVAAP